MVTFLSTRPRKHPGGVHATAAPSSPSGSFWASAQPVAQTYSSPHLPQPLGPPLPTAGQEEEARPQPSPLEGLYHSR